MQQNPSSQTPQKDKTDISRREEILRRLRSILLENWGTKLLAIMIAIVLWAGLITQDPSLTREKQFTDVAVTVNGEDTLKRYGYIVLEDLDEALADVTVRVSVPQGQYKVAQASNYSVRVDLSRLRQVGEQEVKILSTNSATYGTVTEIIPPAVTLTVDEYITRYRIPVTVSIEGEPPAGFYATEPSTDPPMIAVSGPKTLVDKIVSARVVVDQTTLPAKEGVVRRALGFTLVDEAGEEIQSSLLQVTSESVLLDTIVVEQSLYTERVVTLSDLGLVTGTPAKGYEVKGVYITPSTITIAGRASFIDEINLLYANSNVNIDGLTEPLSTSLRIRQPSTLKFISTDSVTIAVEIGPIITSRAYEVPITLTGLAETMDVGEYPAVAMVYVAGMQNWLNSLSIEDFTVECDLSAIQEPGEYTLPLVCVIRGSEDQPYAQEISPSMLTITVQTK